MIPLKEGVDLIENNLVTRVSAQKNFHFMWKKNFHLLMDNSLFEEFDHGSD